VVSFSCRPTFVFRWRLIALAAIRLIAQPQRRRVPSILIFMPLRFCGAPTFECLSIAKTMFLPSPSMGPLAGEGRVRVVAPQCNHRQTRASDPKKPSCNNRKMFHSGFSLTSVLKSARISFCER